MPTEAQQAPIWIVMPIAGAESYTDAAIADVLAQSIPTRILLINQGVASAFRTHLERVVEQNADRVFLWSHQPPLLSLAATWNRGLKFVWECGGREALVVNNDVRLHQSTCWFLSEARKQADALFVSAVGVATEAELPFGLDLTNLTASRGGPDFSCFLISKACHEQYAFDEGFIPAYGEDCDYHRRMLLGGDGDRIFSVNLPYLHYACGTLKSLDPDARQVLERRLGQSREYYAKKWGPINQERLTIPFDLESAQDGVTNPELQRAIQHPEEASIEAACAMFQDEDGEVPLGR